MAERSEVIQNLGKAFIEQQTYDDDDDDSLTSLIDGISTFKGKLMPKPSL